NSAMSTVWVVRCTSTRLTHYWKICRLPFPSMHCQLRQTFSSQQASALYYTELEQGLKSNFLSDTIINRLMLFIVNTGLLTSLFAMATLISLVISPLTLIYATFYFCIGRLYTNSFLATLNARKAITGQVDDVSHMLVSIPPAFSNTRQISTGNKLQHQAISIRIETTQEQHSMVSKNDLVCFYSPRGPLILD
ncbi:hypothetical protein C0992_004491, partial [Termitomyces sp. T32_za158]